MNGSAASSPGDLPEPARRFIAAAVGSARLWSRERTELAEELAEHFRCGLEQGESVEALIAAFGDPERAGVLLGRGVRRRRSTAWKMARAAGFAAAVLLAGAAITYATSWTRLRVSIPAVPPDVRAFAALRLPGESTGNAQQALESSLGRTREEVGRELARALELAADLSRSPAPGEALAGMSLFAAGAEAVARLVRQDQLPAVASGRIAVALTRFERLAALEAATEGTKALMSVLVASMYSVDASGEGRLTVEGLRFWQALHGKVRPGLGSLVLEPAYFALPATRRQVLAEFDRFATLARSGNAAIFGHEAARFAPQSLRGLRYLPLRKALAELSVALVRAAQAEEQARRALGALTERTAAGGISG